MPFGRCRNARVLLPGARRRHRLAVTPQLWDVGRNVGNKSIRLQEQVKLVDNDGVIIN
jgi:hypothetical protein